MDEGKNSESVRRSQISEKTPNYRSYSADIIKLKEVPYTKESSSRKIEKNEKEKVRERKREEDRKLRLSKSSFGKNPERPSSFNLDSKRIIGKSRIFKYLNS